MHSLHKASLSALWKLRRHVNRLVGERLKTHKEHQLSCQECLRASHKPTGMTNCQPGIILWYSCSQMLSIDVRVGHAIDEMSYPI